jgi:hypothetical protein
MIDSGPSFSELGLTKIEAHQAESRSIRPGDELAYIKFYQSHPEKRGAVLANPFSSDTSEQIKQTFGNENRWTVLRSAIIAEPEGTYEQNYRQLARAEQLEKLYDQIDSSAQMTIRIQKYIEENLSNLDNVSDEELYKELCRIAFTSDDESVIQAQYALSQRRGFRLGIANFLEERGILSPYRLESSADPKAFAEKYLKNTFTGNVTIEQLPIGLVIYLDEQDYALIESDDKSPKSIPSKGVTLSSDWLPQELQGKIILLNRGGNESGVKTSDELDSTRGHEIRHIVFRDFHAQQSETYMSDTREGLTRCKTEQDYRQVSEAIYEDFVEKAKDEIIAYFSQGKFDESYSALRFHQYQWHVEEAETALKQRTDLSEETKRAILESFSINRRKCFDTIKKVRLVAERIYKHPDKGALQRIMIGFGLKKDETSHQNDIAEALLRNTPGTKIHRLARYTDLTEEDIRSGKAVKETDQKAIDGVTKLLTVPAYYEEKWWSDASQARDQLRQQLPVESLPVLLEAVSKWSDKEWTSFWTEEAVLLTRDYIKVHGVPEADKPKIKQGMNKVLEKKEAKEFEQSAKFAQEVLDIIH